MHVAIENTILNHNEIVDKLGYVQSIDTLTPTEQQLLIDHNTPELTIYKQWTPLTPPSSPTLPTPIAQLTNEDKPCLLPTTGRVLCPIGNITSAVLTHLIQPVLENYPDLEYNHTTSTIIHSPSQKHLLYIRILSPSLQIKSCQANKRVETNLAYIHASSKFNCKKFILTDFQTSFAYNGGEEEKKLEWFETNTFLPVVTATIDQHHRRYTLYTPNTQLDGDKLQPLQIGMGKWAQVYKLGDDRVLKVFDDSFYTLKMSTTITASAYELYTTELTAYEKGKNLQGNEIPLLLNHGSLGKFMNGWINGPFIIIEYVDTQPHLGNYSLAYNLLLKLHSLGIIHNDVHLDNIKFPSLNRTVFIDFAFSRFQRGSNLRRMDITNLSIEFNKYIK